MILVDFINDKVVSHFMYEFQITRVSFPKNLRQFFSSGGSPKYIIICK